MNKKSVLSSTKIIMFVFTILCTLLLYGCGRTDNLESEGKPVLKTITKDLSDNTTNYCVIYDDGIIKETDSFVADNTEFLYAVLSDYASKVENGKVVVTLKATYLTDSNGHQVETDETVKALMQAIADVSEHDILFVSILIDDGNYYAFVKLNVNWWTPCLLYDYDADAGKLTELYCWDNVDLTGIALK